MAPTFEHYLRWVKYRAPQTDPADILKSDRSIHVHFYTPESMAEVLERTHKLLVFREFSVISEHNQKDFFSSRKINFFIQNLRLATDLTRRELEAKHKRSVLGRGWLILAPLCLLGIYSLVFGQIFGVEWHVPQHQGGGGVGFVLPFFVGLAIYLLLSDVVNSSSVLFASKRTFVVKSPFPIWVLWLSNLMRAGVQASVTLLMVLALSLIQQRLTIDGFLWSFVAILICTIFISGMSLLLASLGPFIGDISEAVRLILRILFYGTPITYPLSLVPTAFREWMWLNPLTCMVELLREPIVFSQSPSGTLVFWFALVSILLFICSLWIFRKVKGVIADVV